MKKFYSLLLAAAVAVCAVSANNVNRLARPSFRDVKKEKIGEIKATDIKGLLPADVPSMSNAVHRIPGGGGGGDVTVLPNPEGQYVMVIFDDEYNQYYGMGEPTIEAQKTANSYIIHQFIFQQAKDVPAKMVQPDPEKEEYELVINGNGKITLVTVSGRNCALYLFGYDEKNQPSIYPNDIPLIYDEEHGELYLAYADCGIAYVDASGYGGWVMDPVLYTPNGVVTGIYEEANAAERPFELPVMLFELRSADEAQTLEMVEIFNMMRFQMPVALQVNAEDGEMVGENAVIGADEDAVTGKPYNIYLMNFMEGNTTYLAAEIAENEQGNTSLVFGEMRAGSPGRADMLKWRDVVLNLNYNIFNPESGDDGVAAVRVDDSNLPVEYFNLQGQRIANPAAGTLVIRRQGTTATKFIIR